MPRVKQPQTRQRKAKRLVLDTRHQFLFQRNLTEAYIVISLDDFSLVPGDRGGYMPKEEYLKKGGMLWPSREAAESAAQYSVAHYSKKLYGVFKLVSISELSAPPAKVTDV